MQIIRLTILVSCAVASVASAADKGAKKHPEPTPLDRYVEEALRRGAPANSTASSGSLWSPNSRLLNVAGDIRANQVDDLITIVVVENASAVANGATKSQRQSSLSASVNALGGQKSPKGALVNLANANSASQLDGQGTTSRSTSISTNLSARITNVLPNGYLVVEGQKDVGINSERQVVTVRGVVRPSDLSTDNIIRSDQIAQMELKVNGKGVVGDAIRRPFILYRIIMGLLPF